MKTLREAARAALDVQNACNLSGVVHAYSRAMTVLWDKVGGGTDAINQHPISVLFAVQVGHLSGTSALCDDLDLYARATRECERLASSEEGS